MKDVKKITDKNVNSSLIVLMCLILGLGFLALLPGCSSRSVGNRMEVMIEMPDPRSFNFDGYENIIYKDLTLEGMPEGYNPDNEIKTFFIDDMSRTIDKKIQHWDRKKHAEMVPKKLLLISGNLKIDVKSRSKIKDVKDQGKKKSKKAFVTVQHWEMTLSLILKDASTGKDVFKNKFKAKLANADPKAGKFNFEKLFFKVTNQFVRKVTRTRKMQRRHILL